MPTARAMVVLKGNSGLPKDRYINTFHFTTADWVTSTLDLIRDRLVEFYNTDPAGVTNGRITFNLANFINRNANASEIRIYRMEDAEPRAPVVYNWTLGASGGSTNTGLPGEVAAVLSYYGTRNIPRRRGRIYIGPFHTGALAADVTGEEGKLGSTTRSGIAGAADRLATYNTGPQWVVYSSGARVQPGESGTVGALLPPTTYAVTAGFVDDAFDIQRRRGRSPSTRTTWTV